MCQYRARLQGWCWIAEGSNSSEQCQQLLAERLTGNTFAVKLLLRETFGADTVRGPVVVGLFLIVILGTDSEVNLGKEENSERNA